MHVSHTQSFSSLKKIFLLRALKEYNQTVKKLIKEEKLRKKEKVSVVISLSCLSRRPGFV